MCLLNPLRLFFATVLLCGWVGAGELQGALHYLNTLRQQSGLIPFKENVQLNRAASNHASYLLRQQIIGHYETRGYKGFTGQTPSDRVILSGYHSKDVMENVSINAHTPKESIENLMAAIYHRFVFLNTSKDEIGFGSVSTNTQRKFRSVQVYDLGSSGLNALCTQGFDMVSGVMYLKNVCKESQKLIPQSEYMQVSDEIGFQNNKVIFYPYSEQRDVPVVFYEEYPDPLPDFKISGYPVSVHFNDAYYSSATLRYFKLYDAQRKEVKARVLTVRNDPNHMLKPMEFALMPLSVLKKGQRYYAVFEAQVDGRAFKKEWTFTTVEW